MKDVNTLRRLLATTAAHFGLPRPAGSALQAVEPTADYGGRRKPATTIAASVSSLAACGPAGAGSRSPICWRHMV